MVDLLVRLEGLKMTVFRTVPASPCCRLRHAMTAATYGWLDGGAIGLVAIDKFVKLPSRDDSTEIECNFVSQLTG